MLLKEASAAKGSTGLNNLCRGRNRTWLINTRLYCCFFLEQRTVAHLGRNILACTRLSHLQLRRLPRLWGLRLRPQQAYLVRAGSGVVPQFYSNRYWLSISSPVNLHIYGVCHIGLVLVIGNSHDCSSSILWLVYNGYEQSAEDERVH